MQPDHAVLSFSLIEYGSAEYLGMVKLRDEVLRRPLGLTFSEEDLKKEIHDILIAAFADTRMVACCILTPQKENTIQLRQMAVDETFRNRNVGLRLLQYAEQMACREGFSTIFMHAREVALGFYKRAGYEVFGDSFEEIGLPHYLMRKKLTVSKG